MQCFILQEMWCIMCAFLGFVCKVLKKTKRQSFENACKQVEKTVIWIFISVKWVLHQRHHGTVQKEPGMWCRTVERLMKPQGTAGVCLEQRSDWPALSPPTGAKPRLPARSHAHGQNISGGKAPSHSLKNKRKNCTFHSKPSNIRPLIIRDPVMLWLKTIKLLERCLD